MKKRVWWLVDIPEWSIDALSPQMLELIQRYRQRFSLAKALVKTNVYERGARSAITLLDLDAVSRNPAVGKDFYGSTNGVAVVIDLVIQPRGFARWNFRLRPRQAKADW
jgi:hypothetical protein